MAFIEVENEEEKQTYDAAKGKLEELLDDFFHDEEARAETGEEVVDAMIDIIFPEIIAKEEIGKPQTRHAFVLVPYAQYEPGYYEKLKEEDFSDTDALVEKLGLPNPENVLVLDDFLFRHIESTLQRTAGFDLNARETVLGFKREALFFGRWLDENETFGFNDWIKGAGEGAYISRFWWENFDRKFSWDTGAVELTDRASGETRIFERKALSKIFSELHYKFSYAHSGSCALFYIRKEA